MLKKFFILFAILMVVEIYLLVLIGRESAWLVIGIIFGTGALGIFLTKYVGLRIISRMGGDLVKGTPPTERMLDGVLVLAGGIGLLLPGVISDFIGLMLMIPGNRRLVKKWLRGYLARKYNIGLFYAGRNWQDIDAKKEDEETHVEEIEYNGK